MFSTLRRGDAKAVAKEKRDVYWSDGRGGVGARWSAENLLNLVPFVDIVRGLFICFVQRSSEQ